MVRTPLALLFFDLAFEAIGPFWIHIVEEMCHLRKIMVLYWGFILAIHLDKEDTIGEIGIVIAIGPREGDTLFRNIR